jgi:hypothetical protein
MKNINTYKLFELGSQDTEIEDQIDALSQVLEYLREPITEFFSQKQMDVDFVNLDEPDEFIIEYWPKSFNGAIPKRISYYIDELCEMLSKQMKTKIDWEFSPNGNVQRLVMSLDDPIDLEHLKNVQQAIKAKQRLKLS